MKLVTAAFRAGTACRSNLRSTPKFGINSFRTSSTEAQTTKTEHEPQGQHEKEKGEDAANVVKSDPFHLDFVNKTVATAAGVLPLSPIMDPSFHKARGQYTVEPKKRALPFHERAELGLGLERNIYGKSQSTRVLSLIL